MGTTPGSETIGNVLAQRYASPEMIAIWSRENKIALERRLWIEVIRAQRTLGIEVGDEVIAAYEKCVDQIDLDSIDRRERETRHDVKARIDEFCALAGYEHIHKGMTSRDLTENVEQLQILESLRLVYERSLALVSQLSDKAEKYRDLVIVARTHNVAAQASTLGKRFATVAEEMVVAIKRVKVLLDTYRIRGIKGAVGSQQDMIDLLGDAESVDKLEESVFTQLADTTGVGPVGRSLSVGQVYPRSFDFDVISSLVQLSSAPANLATTIRLMAGESLVTEGFKPGQVGSSAMPHKMNARTSERINGFVAILRGHLTMVSALVGQQWNEGDVSCSVVRRVALPDAFFTIDGLFESTFSVLEGFAAFEAVIEEELNRYLPFVASTRLLMAAVKAGMGREQAHELVKKHAVAAALARREGSDNDSELTLPQRLGNDPDFALSEVEILELLADRQALIGRASSQIDAVRKEVETLLVEHPNLKSYSPKSIL